MTTMAVISGPNSRVMEMETRLATNCMAPSRCNWYAPCSAIMTPTKKVMSETMGRAPTPTAMAWCTARCARRLPFNGDRNSSRRDFPKS